MKRFLRFAGLLALLANIRAGLPAADHYLLLSQAQLAEARRKADNYEWAAKLSDELLARAKHALSTPIALPDRGGQWPHWYSCPRDGVKLETASPTEHRCPRCGEVYTGEPYDAVVLYGVHRRYSNSVRDLGLAYRFTGQADYGQRAKQILLAYADRYKSYPLHDRFGKEKVGGGHVMAQSLDESVWLIPVAFGYALVKETMSERERRHVEQDLFLPAADIIRQHKMKIHNIQCWKNSAVGLAGFVTGNDELVREAIEDPVRGFHSQIAEGITPDGLWWEGSLGYHRYTMEALWPLAEAARNHGIDLFSDRYRSIYEAPIALALPNGDAPGFNDSAGGNIFAYAGLYELAYARWGIPAFGKLVASRDRVSLDALLYGAAEPPSGSVIPSRSTRLDSAGYAVLRSKAMTVAFRYGMHGGGHGHPDKLNIVTYGADRPGGLDPGSINYGVPLHREWYRSTIAHNTVSVDQKNQRGVDGKDTAWSNVGRVRVAGGEVTGAYPGVTLSRTLTLTEEKLIDIVECVSPDEHTYDWAFHVPGRVFVDLPLAEAAGPMGADNGYQHVTLLRRGQTDDEFTVTWDLDGATLRIKMHGEAGTELFVGQGPGRRPEDPVPMIVVRRHGKQTRFRATHEFTR
jgi:oligo-alginate lyase